MGAGTPASGPNRQSYSSSYSNSNAHGIGAIPRTPAQQLIDQYERLSTPPPGSRASSPSRTKSTYRQSISDPKTHQASGPYGWSDFMDRDQEKRHGNRLLKKEGRSPIRQSLRNLLSVIKKGAGGIAKRKSEDKLGVPYSSLSRVGKDRNRDQPPLLSLSRAADTAKKRSAQGSMATSATDDAQPAPHPRKRMTGPLLYLSRSAQLSSPDVSGPLSWTNCSVTIDGSKLVVSSIVGDIESTIHEISLSRCTDIRSLGVMQLRTEEAELLDRVPEGDKMRVFEVLFEGRQREKFAAKSVRERAGWISAIWYDCLHLLQLTGLTSRA